MTRGEGSLFFPTRTGVRVAAVAVRAPSRPGPTWWAHLCGCAWAAAWLTVRGHEMVGSRELLEDPWWSDEVRWHNANGCQRRGHRPDLVAVGADWELPIEVELAQKAADRLRAILDLHASWWQSGKSSGVLYVCGDEDGAERIRRIAETVGLRAESGGGATRTRSTRGLRITHLEMITARAQATARLARENPDAARAPSGTQLALFAS